MPGFEIINSKSEIVLGNEWVPATKFTSKDRLVDEQGNTASSDYTGRKYRIIDKREHTFSDIESIGRGFLGVLAIICTLGLVQWAWDLLTKSKETKRFAISAQYDVGDFSFVRDEQTKRVLTNAFQAIERLHMWPFFDQDPPEGEGYMFWNTPWLHKLKHELVSDGHSGASEAFTLGRMRIIRKEGWDEIVNQTLKYYKDLDKSEQMACC